MLTEILHRALTGEDDTRFHSKYANDSKQKFVTVDLLISLFCIITIFCVFTRIAELCLNIKGMTFTTILCDVSIVKLNFLYNNSFQSVNDYASAVLNSNFYNYDNRLQ